MPITLPIRTVSQLLLLSDSLSILTRGCTRNITITGSTVDMAWQTARLVVPGLGEEQRLAKSGRVWSGKSAPNIMLSQDVV